MDVCLDTDAVPFGAVIQRSQRSRKVVMYNQGDMKAKFMWDVKRFQPDFSITPVQGYLTPGMEVTFDVTFHPQEIKQDIRYEVTFTNEQTGEYQYYEMMERATRPGMMGSIDLATPARQSVPHTVTLENPLTYAVVFSATCNVPEVLMPWQLSVPAQSAGRFNLEYQPLKAGESQGRLEFMCNDLGLYTYDLNLKATSAGPERAIYFMTCLGTSQAQVAKFLNFAKQKADYSCKVDSPDFHADRAVAAAPGSTGGTEIGLDVTFEPSKIGEQRSTLTISSPHGGEYTFPLFGTCLPPKPQGPFVIKAGSTTAITFRNVFGSPTGFTVQADVDNPAFHLTKSGENIRPRKDHRVVVVFDGNDSGSKSAVMGKLIVSCARSAGGSSNVQWVYYLKGTTP